MGSCCNTDRFISAPTVMKTAPAKKGLRDGTKLRREGNRIIDYKKKAMKDMGF